MKRYANILILLAASLVMGCGEESATDTFVVLGSSSASSAAALRVAPNIGRASFGQVNEGTPTSMNVVIHRILLSATEDCASPIVLADYSAAPQTFDMFDSPTLWTGSPPDGTYPCMIIESNDTYTFNADATAVAAHAGCVDETTEYTYDTYRTDSGDTGLWQDVDGMPIPATGTPLSPGVNKVATFASTNPAMLSAHPNQQMMLTSAMIVPGMVTFYTDFTGQVTENSGTCWLDPPQTGFR